MRAEAELHMPHKQHLDLQGLHSLATSLRALIEPGLPRTSDDQPNACGTCLDASFLVIESLRTFTICECVLRGGGNGDGGLFAQGQWQGHYWVEVTLKDRTQWVVDITADQFGYAKVTVMPLPEARSIYRPGDDTHAQDAYRMMTKVYDTQQRKAA